MTKKIVQTKALNIGEELIPYSLYESAVARNIWLKVGIGGKIEVTKPWHVSIYKVEEFLKSKIIWIRKKIKKYQKLGEKSYFYNFVDGEHINLFGKKYKIKLATDVRGRENYTLTGVESILRATPMAIGGVEKFIQIDDTAALINIYAPNYSMKPLKTKFENFLKSQIKKYIFEETRNIASQNNFQYNKIAIRSQKTRWGSCSKNKNLNFNWRLVFFPREVINYVILHELAHTKELNHSKNFWHLIAQICPEYKNYIKQLK